MPNWCENTVSLNGNSDDLITFMDHVKSKTGDGAFSFQSILPIPDVFNDLSSGSAETGYDVKYGDWRNIARYPWVQKHGLPDNPTRENLCKLIEKEMPDAFKLADRYKECIDETGYLTWYEWCVAVWGTKWDITDAYMTDECEYSATYSFDTAWCPPEGIYLELLNYIGQNKLDINMSWYYHEPGCQLVGYL